LTIDHRVRTNPSEEARVKEKGGIILKGRVWGSLMITRSFGDREAKTPNKAEKCDKIIPGVIIAVPEINVIELTKKSCFLLLASDGIWDVLKPCEAVNIASKQLRLSPNAICEQITRTAKRQNLSSDDMTVVIALNLNNSK